MGRSQPSALPPQEAVVRKESPLLLRVREAKPEAAQPRAGEGHFCLSLRDSQICPSTSKVFFLFLWAPSS